MPTTKLQSVITFVLLEAVLVYFMLTAGWSAQVLLVGAVVEMILLSALFTYKVFIQSRSVSSGEAQVLQNLSHIPETRDTLNALYHAGKSDTSYSLVVKYKETIGVQVAVVLVAAVVVYLAAEAMGEPVPVVDFVVFSGLLLASHLTMFYGQYITLDAFKGLKFKSLQRELLPVGIYVMIVITVVAWLVHSHPDLLTNTTYILALVGVKLFVDIVHYLDK